MPIKLSEIEVACCYSSHEVLSDFITNNNISLRFPSSISVDTLVIYHGAIYTHSDMLASNGDFVKVVNHRPEVQCYH